MNALGRISGFRQLLQAHKKKHWWKCIRKVWGVDAIRPFEKVAKAHGREKKHLFQFRAEHLNASFENSDRV